MLYTYHYRLYPTPDQEILCNKHFGCNRFVYNYFLYKRVKDYHETGHGSTYLQDAAQLPNLKASTEWLWEAGSQSLQYVLKCLQTAYERFFKKLSKFPRLELMMGSHNLSKHPLYIKWSAMKSRCHDDYNYNWDNYGSRGISVCAEWEDFLPFYEWAIVAGWKEGLTIDRIDNNGNYTPENCRWVDMKTQANNRRGNVIIEAFGEKKTLSQWYDDDRCMVEYTTLAKRIQTGWNAEEALTELDSRTFEAFGEYKSLAEWANDPRCKVNANTLAKRITFYGWSVEDAITQPLNYTLHEAFGEQKLVDEWILDERCKVGRHTLYDRIKDGWEFEKALITPNLPFSPKAKGVYYDKKRNKWEAGIGQGKFKHLGRFDTEVEAIAARKEAERILLLEKMK